VALTTLTAVKAHLGISDSSEDTLLAQLIGGASWAIRRDVGDYLYGVISANTLANPTVVTSYGHGLESSDVITIAADNSDPTIGGAQTVTLLTADTFSVPVNVTTAGTSGVFARTYTEYYDGTGSRELVLRHRPVQSITSVYVDDDGYYGEGSSPFASADLLTAGEDYCLKRDNASESEASLSGVLLRIGSVWSRPSARVSGLLSSVRGNATGNIKVTYVAGYLRAQPDVALATNQLIAELRRSARDGGALQSESYDYYSYTRQAASEQLTTLSSAMSLLRRFKRWVW